MTGALHHILAATLSILLAAPAYSHGLNIVYDAPFVSQTNLRDEHGSVRALTDQTGTVTDTYDYDAFGNLIHSTGTTYNNYLFAGEQLDPDLNLYYNRARYLNVSTGRFWSMDTHEGDDEDPTTLHKYLYARAAPVDLTDRSGNDFDLGSLLVAVGVEVILQAIPTPLAQEYRPGGSAEPRVATAQSERGKTFLKYHEGLGGQPELEPYDHDGSATSNCTVGWGHKIRDGRCLPTDYSTYANFNEEAAEQLLIQDVQTIAMPPIKKLVHVGLAQRELDALIDFTFNIRWGLAKSQLLQQLNTGNYKQAGNGFLGWQIPRSIKGRRVDEKNLWDTGRYVSNGYIIP